jgi:hypothetical protein
MKQCKYDTPCNCVRCTAARAEARRVRQEAEAAERESTGGSGEQ